jgi:hypothetical protein
MKCSAAKSSSRFHYHFRVLRHVLCLDSWLLKLRTSQVPQQPHWRQLEDLEFKSRQTQEIHRVTEAVSVGVKRTRRDADHSPPPSVEVTNEWSYTSTPPTYMQGMCRATAADTSTILTFHNLVVGGHVGPVPETRGLLYRPAA